MTSAADVAPSHDVLAAYEQAGLIEPADRHIATTVGRLAGEASPEVLLAIALAARAPRHGHVAVDLATVAASAIDEIAPDRRGLGFAGADAPALPWPDPADWLVKVRSSGLVAVLDTPRDDPDPTAPVVLVGSLLYLQKYWVYERSVARQLRQRAALTLAAEGDDTQLEVASALLTGEGSEDQLRAVAAGVSRALTVLVGGPGTGKTTTVAALVAQILSDRADQGSVSIALAAPTGKAAARLGEAFASAARGLPPDLAGRLGSVEASTIHRLVGARWQQPTRFHHHRDRPLPHDLVIVDEASMISMPLMARLLDAIRPEARCVIVGDPGQLASVEAGSVLADIAGARDDAAPEDEQRVIRLRYSRRFPDQSPIGRLARAITTGDVSAALSVLRDPQAADAPSGALRWVEHAPDVSPLDDLVTRHAVRDLWWPALEQTARHAAAGDPQGALEAMMRVRVVCAHRRGPFGVQAWNRLADMWVHQARAHEEGPRTLSPWYPGRVVMMTDNDARRGLFNGDLGVVVRLGGRMVVAFHGAQDVRLFSIGQFEGLESAAAMTIHKSQGSEFSQVLVVLPAPESRLATRELVYTGVTRATTQMTLVGSEAAVRAAVSTRVSRASGLRDQLW